MNKKLICIRVMIGIICLIIIGIFIHVVISIEKHISDNIEVVEETVEERIVFDMTLPPSKQKNLKGHVKEYMSQVYDYLFHDIKWKNIKNPYPYDYSQLKKKENLKNFYEILRMTTMPRLINVLFDFENPIKYEDIYLDYPLNMDDIPVTENYKEKHPRPLFEEFDFIKKEDYETKKKYDANLETNTWLYLNYEYGVGVDEEEKTIHVGETKSVTFLYIDDEGEERTRVTFDDRGNEMTENSIETREFVFKYTLDEKGYVDDIKFVKEIKLADDKYLDRLWENVKV